MDKKAREIYFVDNVKIHLYDVQGLGKFIELEAIASGDDKTEAFLKGQVEDLMKKFKISPENLTAVSYSDMIMEKRKI